MGMQKWEVHNGLQELLGGRKGGGLGGCITKECAKVKGYVTSINKASV